MKPVFPLALLCLLLTSCYQDLSEMSDAKIRVQSRTIKPIKATILLQNGSTYQNDVIRAKCSAISSTTMSVKLFLSTTDSITYACKNLLIEDVNNKLELNTLLPNVVFTDKSTCLTVPYSSSSVKMTIQSGNITVFPNSFIGEEQDSF